MIDLTVRPDAGDEFELQVQARDVLRWERARPGKSFSKLMDDLNMVDLYLLAHIAAQRQGLYQGSLADFESTCELVILDDDDEGDGEGGEVDPTRPGR